MKSGLEQIIAQYQAGSLAKSDFITAMYAQRHAALFDYAMFLQRTNIKQIAITDNAVIMTSRDRGIRIQCIPGDVRVAPIEILNFGDYEVEHAAMMHRLAAGARVILDIGANIGWHALNFAAAFPQAMVHAFEPLATTFSYLQANIHLNPFRNLQAHHLGFAERSGTMTFYVYPEGSWNASAVNLTERSDVETVTCPVLTLDAFVADRDLTLDFIKCDVEGAELHVIKGGAGVIARDLPVVCAEVLRKWSAKFGYDPNDIFAFFRHLGYAVYVVRGQRLRTFAAMDESTVDTNFFFLHPGQHAALLRQFVDGA